LAGVAGSGQTSPANQRRVNGARLERPRHDFVYTAALREDSQRLLETSRELRRRFGSRFAKSS
jgi:hypothetical protein